MDQLLSPPTSVFTDPSTKEFHPARSVKYNENIVIEINILQLDALPKTNTVRWQQQQKLSVLSRSTIIQNYILLISSFHLKCLLSIPFTFSGHGPIIIPFYPESWNNFRFEVGAPREHTWKPATWKVSKSFYNTCAVKTGLSDCRKQILSCLRAHFKGCLPKW